MFTDLQKILDHVLPSHQHSDGQGNKIFDKKKDFFLCSVYDADSIVTCYGSQGCVRRSQVVSDTNLPRVRLSATSN
jgi:hypothetical protein